MAKILDASFHRVLHRTNDTMLARTPSAASSSLLAPHELRFAGRLRFDSEKILANEICKLLAKKLVA